MVAISHGKGVVLSKQYFGAITGGTVPKVIRTEFDEAFAARCNPDDKVFLQDGCSRQNNAIARRAWKRKGAEIFQMPVRSPDLSPKENMLNFLNKELRKQAIVRQINKETFEEFSERVQNTLINFNIELTDSIIETMGKRIDEVIRHKGHMIKY